MVGPLYRRPQGRGDELHRHSVDGRAREPEGFRDLLPVIITKSGSVAGKTGLLYGYHNHAHEFQKVEGETMYDYMLSHTDPENVFFQMDVYWVVRGQNSPVDYFFKFPGRFKDAAHKGQPEIGQSGMVGFDAIFRNVKKARRDGYRRRDRKLQR